MKAVFDTNILIDLLDGRPEALTAFQTYSDRLVSRINWLEVLAGADTAEEDREARDLLGKFRLIELDAALSEQVLALRLSHPRKIKLPDAIVYATAKAERCTLLTLNTHDFERGDGDVVAPYQNP